jgi:hypothetical protein
MGVRLLSRWARGPVRSMGIDPAKRPARDAQVAGHVFELSERARMSRWARGPVRSMGIDPAKRPACDAQVAGHVFELSERARMSRWAWRAL